MCAKAGTAVVSTCALSLHGALPIFMYGGRIMERGPVRSVFHDPRSAYTWGLLKSLPHGGRRGVDRLYQIPGNPPDLSLPPVGDPFAPRNPFATERCYREVPPLRDVEDGQPGHQVAAWYDLRKELEAEHGN